MTFDFTDRVTLDPRLSEHEVSVSAMSLTWDGEPGDPPDSKSEYKFAAALRRPHERWPKLDFTLQVYDRNDLLVSTDELTVKKTLDKQLRQVTSSPFHYAPRGERFEVVVAAPAQDAKEEDKDGWEPLPVRVDDEDLDHLGLTLDAHDAEAHPSFEANNLTTVHFTAQFGRTGDREFPDPLYVAVSVHDDQDRVLITEEFRLDQGPRSRRSLSGHTTVYNHRTPAYVLIGPYTTSGSYGT